MWRRVLGWSAIGLCLLGVETGLWIFSQQNQPSPIQVDDQYRFVTTPCWFTAPWQEDIVCGKLHTPAASGSFTLPVVRIRDYSLDHQPDPVIYLPGGPGGSARLGTEGIEHWMNWLHYAQLGRDLILMEPRGVGLSQPDLRCRAYDQFSLDILKKNVALAQELTDGYTIVAQCFAEFSRRGVSAGNVTTRRGVEDVQALMRLLSAQNPAEQQWNLLGVSYGSRLALLAAQDFPQVRSLILDSVYPPGYGGIQEWPALFEQSLQRYLAWCEATESCRGTGELKIPLLERLLLALDSLRATPVTLNVRRWDGEPPIDVVVNDHRFLSAVFAALYSHHDWEKIAPAFEAAITHDRSGLMAMVEPFINQAFSDDFNALAFMAVDCHDHPPLAKEDYRQEINRHPLFADYLRDLWRYQPCHFLSTAGVAPLELATLPHQPALLLAGGMDPITPTEWAQELHNKWHNSQLIVRENIGHAVINSEACIHRSLRRFLDEPDKKMVTACETD